MSLNKKIAEIRVELQNTKLRKSGKNKFAGFEYFELSDFLPTLNSLMAKHEVNDRFTIEEGRAVLFLNWEGEEQPYEIPFVMFDVPTNKNGQPSMQHIQYLGALNTYYKRYLYMNAFGITDGEVIDAMESPSYKTQSKSSDDEKKLYWDEFTVICGENNVKPRDFLEQWAGIDGKDQKAMFNAVSKYLRDQSMFKEQLSNFKANSES